MCYSVHATVFTFFCLLVFWLRYVSKYLHCCVCVKVFFYCVSVLVTICVQMFMLLCMFMCSHYCVS